MSSTAIDTSRTNERLSAFMSEIGTKVPVDNFFGEEPTLDHFVKNAKRKKVGRQIITPILMDDNDSVQFSSDYDLVDTTAQDAVVMLTYAIKRITGAATLSDDEIDEYSGKDHMLIDRIATARRDILKSAAVKASTALFAASPGTDDPESLPNIIASSGASGQVNASTVSTWAAESNASTGDLLADMHTLYNEIQNQATQPSAIVTDQTVYESFNNTVDVDVRYVDMDGTANRGFSTLKFRGKPLWFDGRCTASTMYMWNDDHLYLVIEPDKDRRFMPFENAYNQFARSSKFIWKYLLMTDRRLASGKLTSIS